MKVLRGLLCVGLLLVGSCSRTFEITPKMIDGQLTFIDERTPDRCVSSVMVMKMASDAAPDESHDRWRARTTAWVDYGGYGCDDRLPLVYGQALRGNAEGSSESEVAPALLEVGEVYVVAVGSGATAMGSANFRMLADGRVEELPRAGLTGEDTAP